MISEEIAKKFIETVVALKELSYSDVEAYQLALEAFKNSVDDERWVKFNQEDKSTWPSDGERIIVETGIGVYQGIFHSEYICPEYLDKYPAYFEFCTDVGWKDDYDVGRWCKLPEPPKDK